MGAVGIRNKSLEELELQLRQVEERIGEPLWLGEEIPASELGGDLKLEYPAKYNLYLKSLRSIQNEQEKLEKILLTPQDQTRLQIINNIERFARGDYEFSEGSISLFPYQKELFSEIASHIQTGASSGWGKLPTGYGKSIVGAALSVATGMPSVILVPRLTLVKDAKEAVAKIAPDRTVSVFSGEEKDLSGDIVVVLYQSLASFNREAKRAGLEFPVATFDEAHLALTQLKQKLIKEIPGLIYTFAETATPYYTEGKHVGLYFGDQIYEMTLPEGIELGILSTIREVYLNADIDLSNIQISSQGNYNKIQLARAMERAPLADIFCQIATSEAFRGKAGVGFVPSIVQSEEIARALRSHGVRALAVHGNLRRNFAEKRQELFESGRVDFLVSPQLLSIGWDSRRVEYALDVDPTRARVDKEQRIGRLARRSAHAPVKYYVELLPRDSRKPVVTASMILGNTPMLAAPGTTNEQREKSDRDVRKLVEGISISGIEVVVEIDQIKQIDLVRDKDITPIDDEVVRTLLVNLPPYVLRDLNRGKTTTFLGYPFQSLSYNGTGRALTRQYYSEIVGEPLDRISDDDIYQMIQTVLPTVGRFKFLDSSGAVSIDSFREIMINNGIDSRAAFDTLGKSGISSLRLRVNDEVISGIFLLKSVARSMNTGGRLNLNESDIAELAQQLFPSDLSSSELLNQRRAFLRGLFEDQIVLLTAPEAVSPSRIYLQSSNLNAKASVRNDRIILRHLNAISAEPIARLRSGHLFEFLADLFPEHYDRFTALTDAFEAPVSNNKIENVGAILRACGYEDSRNFDDYGETILLAASGKIGKYSYIGLSALRIYRELRELKKRNIPVQAAIGLMADEVLGATSRNFDSDPLEQVRKFLQDAGLDAAALTKNPTALMMRTTISHQGINTSIERLYRASVIMRTGRNTNSVRTVDIKQFIIDLFPEAEQLFRQRSDSYLTQRRKIARGELNKFSEPEIKFASVFGNTMFSNALFEIDGAIRGGEHLIYSAERGLAIEHSEREQLRINVERAAQEAVELSQKKQLINETVLPQIETSSLPKGLSLEVLHARLLVDPQYILKNFRATFEQALAFLLDCDISELPAQIEEQEIIPYVKQIFELNNITRNDIIESRYEDIIKQAVSVGRVTLPLGRLIRQVAGASGYRTRYVSVSLRLNEIFPDVEADRAKHWIEIAREVLTSAKIHSASNLMKLEPLKFYRLQFDHPKFSGNGAALVTQVQGETATRSLEVFKNFANTIFPGQEVEGALAYICSESGAYSLRRFILEFCNRSIEEINQSSVLLSDLMPSMGAQVVEVSRLRRMLGKANLLPKGTQFSEEDLIQLMQSVSDWTKDPDLIKTFAAQRKLLPIREQGGLDKTLRAFVKKRPHSLSYQKFASMRILKNGEEFKGSDVLRSLRIKTPLQFTQKVEEIKLAQGSAPVTQIVHPKNLSSDDSEVLFSDKDKSTQGILEQTLLELAPQYLGEFGGTFDKRKFNINKSAVLGKELRGALIGNGLLNEDEDVSTEKFVGLVESSKLNDSEKVTAKIKFQTSQLLDSLSVTDFLKVVNTAKQTLELGAGANTLNGIRGKIIVCGSNKISAEVFAHYIAQKFDVSVEDRIWQAQLLPKLIKPKRPS